MDHTGRAAQIETLGYLQPATFMGLDPSDLTGRPQVAIVGVPWDGGTAYHAGARLGPAAIRLASRRLRRIHYGYGIAPFDLCRITDLGDVPVNPFDRAVTLRLTESFYQRLAQQRVSPVTIGGDHLVTLPVLRGIARGRPVALVHFDAHFDVADSSADEGEPYTSATPFRRAIEEGLIDPKRMIQIGIRSSVRTLDMVEWAAATGIRTIGMAEFHRLGASAVAEEVRRVVGNAPAYVTVDVDAIDPAFLPGTGTPVIGGLSTTALQQVLYGLRGLDIVGGDIVEVSPPYDVNGISALVGASLTFDLLCLIALNHQRHELVRQEAAASNTH